MRKILSFLAIVISCCLVATLLTSGISKEMEGGGRDMVEELYSQAVKQNDNLEDIEDVISDFYKKKNEATEKYNSFTSYNNRYYTDARATATGITDVATKQRAVDLINQSEAAYKTKLAGWETTLTTLSAKQRELDDLHLLLKLIITRPMIEKYQSAEMPDKSKLNEADEELQKVISKIKAITK